MFAQLAEIWIAGQPGEITIAELDGLFQCLDGALELVGQRIAAGKVVKDERVLRLQFRQAFVHFQAFVVPATPGVVVPQQLQRVHVSRIPADDTLDEPDLDIQIALLGAADLLPGTAFLRHTTGGVFARNRGQVKRADSTRFAVASRTLIGQTPARMKCFVTGASGFVGANLVQELTARGHQVKALLRAGSDIRGLTGANYERVTGDVSDGASLRTAMQGCDWCFHVAASYHLWLRDYAPMYAANVAGTRNVIEAAAAAGCSRIVYTSTVGCIGLPREVEGKLIPTDESAPATEAQMSNHYKRSKWQAEQVARELARRGLPVVIVNPSAPVGPRDVKPTPTGQVIVDVLNRAMPAYLDTGLNWVHVRDVAVGHILAAERGRIGERYILGHAAGNWTLKQALEVLAQITGQPAPKFRVPYPVALAAAYGNEAFAALSGRPPKAPLAGVRMARYKMFFNPAKAIRELGLPQTPPKVALADAVDWFRANGYVKS